MTCFPRAHCAAISLVVQGTPCNTERIEPFSICLLFTVPDRNEASWNFLHQAQHPGGSTDAATSGQGAHRPGTCGALRPGVCRRGRLSAKQQVPACSASREWGGCPYGDTHGVRNSTWWLCFVLLILESWNVRRGGEDHISCLLNWGR